MKKLIPLIFVMTACGGGSGGVEPEPLTTQQPATVVSQEQYCEGTTLYEDTTYSDGTVEKQLIEQNSTDCGYEPPPEFGTPVGDSYCANTLAEDTFNQLLETVNHFLGVDRVQDYADGEGGVYTERVEHLDQSCFVQMEQPESCPTARTDTGDSRYDYITCDGIKQSSSVSFPYEPENKESAIIDMLIVFDTNLSEEDRDGMTVEEFVDHQVYLLNHMYTVSRTYTLIRVADIKMVDVAAGDLYRQYDAFFNARSEFTDLDTWQREAKADLAFLFKKKPEAPIACGVANLDATRGIDKTRGITQCFHNSTFQENSTTRYYERANETFAHEVGHLLGAQHQYEDAKQPGIFEYSYGHNLEGYNPQSDNLNYEGIYGGYGTIMSYADLATGRFSDYDVNCIFPEEAGEAAGQSVALGTTGGCFCVMPEEDKPPPTNNAEGIARTRWMMSQLHEMEHGIQFNMPVQFEAKADICLF